MGLNIEKQTGSFLPWVKFNGKSGRWSAKIDGVEQEVNNPTFVADFANIKTGWLKFGAPGIAPEWVEHVSLTSKVARPSPDHKEGFRVNLFSKASFGGVVNMMANSMHLTAAIAEMYDEYEAGLAANKGKLPVIKCTGVDAMKDKMGTNYKPKFKLEKWIDRPVEFDETETESKPAAAPVKAAPVENVSEF
jgi:hypothetical protein